MLVVLIIILVLIWAAVVWSIYSNFMVFYSNFSESENYHKAYYTSISALERWELVTKQRLPWYTWYAWRYRSWTTSSNQSIWYLGSDWVISSNFSYLSNWEPSKIVRSVDSRTTRIPKTTWNVEFTLRSSDSYNYNAMDYENAEIFLLYYDWSSDSPYKKAKCDVNSSSNDCLQSRPWSITGRIRLPKHLVESWGFTVLNTWMALIWVSNDLPGDDTIVDRQIRWTYNNGPDKYPYTVFSTQSIHSGKKVNYRKDSIFRESDFNNSPNHALNFRFWNNWNPFIWNHWEWIWAAQPTSVESTIISQAESSLKSFKFSWLFTSNNTQKNQIRFNLLNLVKDKNWKIYPFLEYYVNFWTGVSDKYYTIKWEWAFSDFQVNTIIQKPTVKESVLSDFTSIF